MKKRYVIIIIAILIILALGAFFVNQILIQKGKEYEIEKIEQYNYFMLKQNDLYGVIDKKGNTIIPPEYEQVKIPNPEKAIFICYKAEQTKVFNDNAQTILTQYNKVEPKLSGFIYLSG